MLQKPFQFVILAHWVRSAILEFCKINDCDSGTFGTTLQLFSDHVSFSVVALHQPHSLCSNGLKNVGVFVQLFAGVCCDRTYGLTRCASRVACG
jgi:hypothetical protein